MEGVVISGTAQLPYVYIIPYTFSRLGLYQAATHVIAIDCYVGLGWKRCTVFPQCVTGKL